jgi:methionyl-tRNA formyltransferase
MNIIILTSCNYSYTSLQLEYLLKNKNLNVVAVICSKAKAANNKKNIIRKLKKIYKIGFLGAINGIRMRSWFDQDNGKVDGLNKIQNICNNYNINFNVVETINCDETRQIFRESNSDLGLSLGNGYIAKSVFSIPKYGMLNVHHEILPNYQNAQSVLWQLYNKSSNTGYTIHKIDKYIDKGEILYQKKIGILFENTLAKTVSVTYKYLLQDSAKEMVNVLNNFDFFYLNAQPQGEGRSYTTPTICQFFMIYYHYLALKRNTNSALGGTA